MEKRKAFLEGLPFLRYNTYKDYHLMIFQALPLINLLNFLSLHLTLLPIHIL